MGIRPLHRRKSTPYINPDVWKGCAGVKKKGARNRYVLLDLGDHFAAGRVIRNSPHMITLEVHTDKGRYRPGYSRDTINKMVTIDERTAKALAPFSYPPNLI
ncbi:hypothetical protein [Alicyclobacillus dauci]|uniref:Uncharacterized protein n=1 Tax=Alicyclobacillus dauci TaxID=1475485 RepID=A0ABY6Z7I6_9BACL|nr:hypothetical protein [Alicyclobacillus dauci]WAH38754.1 hypothetical protein NZD86_09870 [Alicyclobacillus dauci]